MRVEERIEIARGPEDVWDFVVDHFNDPQWCHKVKAVERAGENWTVWHKPVPLRPAERLLTCHLREDRPSYLEIREEDRASVFVVEYRLERTPAGTQFTQVSKFDWKSLPRPLHRIFAHGVRRDVSRQLRALKRRLEAIPTAHA